MAVRRFYDHTLKINVAMQIEKQIYKKSYPHAWQKKTVNKI